MRPSPLGPIISTPRLLPDRKPMQSQTSRWTAQELVVRGGFAAAAKISSLLIALAGGGMNPVMLILKNLVFTTLLVVLLTKVPKSGTLLLFTAVTMLVSLLLLGGSIALIPAAFIGAAAGEIAGKLAGGFGRLRGVIAAVAAYDLVSKSFSLGVAYLFLRESPGLMQGVIPIVGVSYLGCLLGLWGGKNSVAELRHAGLIRGGE